MYYIHKHKVSLQYGGPEEGGWWYDAGVPDESWNPHAYTFGNEDLAYDTCRELNKSEYERREKEEDYEYTSTLSWRSNHYQYSVRDNPTPYKFPDSRPHYE